MMSPRSHWKPIALACCSTILVVVVGAVVFGHWGTQSSESRAADSSAGDPSSGVPQSADVKKDVPPRGTPSGTNGGGMPAGSLSKMQRGPQSGVSSDSHSDSSSLWPAPGPHHDAEVRHRIASLSFRLAQRDRSTSNAAILATLEKPLDMTFPNETPLEDVIKYIGQVTKKNENDEFPGIPIYVDPVGLNEAEKTSTSPVILDLHGVPLKTTLRLLLKQLDLAYCVKDGVLIISSLEGILDELMEADEQLRFIERQ